MEENDGVSDERVLGVKVEFFRRGVNSFYITAARPIPIEGITKTVSVWVAGRNQGHSMYLLVQDYFGNNFEIYMGTLAFSGWKKMTAAVPPSPDGERGIVQQSAYYGEKPGLRIVGFRPYRMSHMAPILLTQRQTLLLHNMLLHKRYRLDKPLLLLLF